jgi:hypothetical protein
MEHSFRKVVRYDYIFILINCHAGAIIQWHIPAFVVNSYHGLYHLISVSSIQLLWRELNWELITKNLQLRLYFNNFIKAFTATRIQYFNNNYV